MVTTTPSRVSRSATTTTRTRGPAWSSRWPGRDGAARCAGRPRTARGVERGRGVAGHRARPRPRPGRGGGVPDRAAVAKDRVISTVDPETRHGHKTAARGFDGYKGHVGLDPDSEIITATTVSAGNAGDASVAEDLIADLLDEHDTDTDTDHDTGEAAGAGTGGVADEVVEASDTAGAAGPCSGAGPAGDAGSDAGSDRASDLLQRPRGPDLQVLQHLVGDQGDGVLADRGAVHLGEVCADLASGHPKCRVAPTRSPRQCHVGNQRRTRPIHPKAWKAFWSSQNLAPMSTCCPLVLDDRFQGVSGRRPVVIV